MSSSQGGNGDGQNNQVERGYASNNYHELNKHNWYLSNLKINSLKKLVGSSQCGLLLTITFLQSLFNLIYLRPRNLLNNSYRFCRTNLNKVE